MIMESRGPFFSYEDCLEVSAASKKFYMWANLIIIRTLLTMGPGRFEFLSRLCHFGK